MNLAREHFSHQQKKIKIKALHFVIEATLHWKGKSAFMLMTLLACHLFLHLTKLLAARFLFVFSSNLNVRGRFHAQIMFPQASTGAWVHVILVRGGCRGIGWVRRRIEHC